MEKIGRYHIERIIGRGATGVVYLGHDPLIERRVALKALRSDLDPDTADETRQRFIREAQAAGRLAHPNIVTVYDAGVDPDSGIAFIAMEYLEGQPLQDLIDSATRLTPKRVAELAVILANALDHAHRQGVVHRDVKPANIMFTGDGVVKITDFGIARLEYSALTVLGTIIGTPFYMPPEQILGQKVERRSDLYSLGVILYELLTGRRPFTDTSLPELMHAIVHKPAPDPLSIRPGLPRDLAEVILRCLNKEPDQRFESGAQLAAALSRLDLESSAADEPDVTVGVGPQQKQRIAGCTLHLNEDGQTAHLWWRSELLLGRDRACEICVAAGNVSRRHGVLFFTESAARYLDLASANGSTINGTKIDGAAFLADGDILGLGLARDMTIRLRKPHGRVQTLVVTLDSTQHVMARSEVLIGSDPNQADIVLTGTGIAPAHAKIELAAGIVIASSLVDDDPILVDGQPTTNARLGGHHTLQLGSASLTWEGADGA